MINKADCVILLHAAKALEDEAAIIAYSYTDLVGEYKGRFAPHHQQYEKQHDQYLELAKQLRRLRRESDSR